MKLQQDSSPNDRDSIDTQASFQGVFQTRKPSLKASLKALAYKNIKIQSRNCCSNVCQIITPIICLLFTLFVRAIVDGITTGAVKSYNFPQPINLPYFNMAARKTLNLSCKEMYYFQSDLASEKTAKSIIRLQHKDYCYDQGIFNPEFYQKSQISESIMERLKQADLTAFERGDDLVTEIPDGLLMFRNSNQTKLQVRLSINDYRLPEYHKNNGVTKILIKTSQTSVIGTYIRVTQGMMSLIDRLTRPFLQTLTRQSQTGEEIIAGSYMYMPFSGQDTAFIEQIVNIAGSGLYPLGLSLLMPIFLYMVVSEKEQRQIQIMKMNGLDPKHYWVNFFIFSFLLCMITSLNMYVIGAFVVDIMFFRDTALTVLWTTFVGWAIAMIALTSFVQIFITNSKTATIVGYLLSIFSTLIGGVISTFIFPIPMELPFYLLIYPPFALSRIVYYIGWSCANTNGCYQSLSGVDSELAKALFVLYGWFLVYLGSVWLNEMVQQQYGVARTPAFIRWCLKAFRKDKPDHVLMEQVEPSISGGHDANEVELRDINDSLIDQSVHQHRQKVINGSNYEALVMKDISKKYEGDNGEKDKIALKPLTMKLIKGEIFGFLGPNGAGKTTLISVITGMYPQTSGNAWIGGLQIGHPTTNQLIGVCPQFDILWSSLTVEEHLRFYCTLKQVPDENITSQVQELMREVDLVNQRDYYINQLSGGMQRRVSIACALSGNPSVVILDEPSSGLDPYHRRQIWKILERCKKRTSIFMTSHLMDEVQFLCDRIGIISQGQMRCIGDLPTLKQKFGKGYRLTISYPTLLKSVQGQTVRPLVVEQLIMKLKLEIVSQLQTRVVLKIDRRDMRECIEKLKQEPTLDWCINQPSLYDVFMHFVK